MHPTGADHQDAGFFENRGYRHASIEPGSKPYKAGRTTWIDSKATEDAGFTQENLQQYNVILLSLVLLEDVFDESQQLEFQRWVQAGGGFVGIHSATNTEYDWALVQRTGGGYFASHPPGVSGSGDRAGGCGAHFHPTPAGKLDPARMSGTISKSSSPPPTNCEPERYHLSTREAPWAKIILSPGIHEFDGGRGVVYSPGAYGGNLLEPFVSGTRLGGIQYAAGEGNTDYSCPTVAPGRNCFEEDRPHR